MKRFTVIPQDTFEGLQLDAGVLLKTFNPAAPAALRGPGGFPGGFRRLCFRLRADGYQSV